MAYLTVLATANVFIVDFGVYSGIVPAVKYKKATFQKSALSFQLDILSSFVRVEDRSGDNWAVSYDGSGETLKIDTVNGISPTSNVDLFNLLSNCL